MSDQAKTFYKEFYPEMEKELNEGYMRGETLCSLGWTWGSLNKCERPFNVCRSYAKNYTEKDINLFYIFKNLKTKKEFHLGKNNRSIKNELLIETENNTNTKKINDCLIISSNQEIHGIKSYLIICNFDEKEENNPKNIEILKVFVSQALFLYSYLHKEVQTCSPCNCPPCEPKK